MYLLKIYVSTIKKVCFCILVYMVTSLYSLSAQCPAGLSGTYSIGPAGNFLSITSAITSLQANGLANHVILELQTGYSGSVETYPLTFPALPCQDSFMLTLRPATGTAGFSLSTISSTAVVLDGIHNLVIDGRPGGTGSAKELTIESTASNGNAINIRNDASGNILEYLIVKSVATSATNGIILFNTTTGTTGNDNNRISYCDIGHPVSFSSNLVYATGTAGKENNNNEISNNNLFDFFSTSINSSGINITQNNSAYIITGNSFYQTASLTFATTGISCFGIRVSTTTGINFTVNGNFIGGTAPNCGSTALTCTGPGFPGGINISTATTGVSNINNNTISNLSMTLTNGSCAPTGIYIAGGKINCGTTTGNIIGSQSITNSIIINSSAASASPLANFAAITGAGNDTVTISNNLIGGIAASGTGRLSLYGILLSGSTAYYNIASNTIGNPGLSNSITNSATVYALIQGINSSASSTTLTQTFTGNLVANLNNTNVNTNTQVAGIYTSGGKHSLTNNTIRDLSGSAAATGTNTASVIGISCITGTGAQTISGNSIYALTNNNASASPVVIGINACNSSTTATLQVNNNFIHSLSATGTGNVILTGIHSACGNTSVYNNMIRLGVDKNGNSVNGNYEIRGIYQGVLTATQKISFNSVYIGGTYSGNQNTYAFYDLDSLVTKKTSSNIFVNARSTSSGTGKNYAVLVRGNKKKPQGLTMNGNLYFAPGTAGYIGFFNGSDHNNFSVWRDVTGVDSMSGKGDPAYINPGGNSSAVNLHLSGTTAAEGVGILDTLIQYDFDNDARSAFTPVDIGADAGNFTPTDVVAPTLTYTALNNNPSLSNRTIQVKIADAGTGVPVSGSFQPKIWFRRTVPSVTAWVSTAGTLITGNGMDGTWDFVIDYSALGVTPAAQDVYQYYFTAQDLSPNLELSPAIGGSHTDVNTQVTAPTNALSYRLLAVLPATVNVGTGEQFTTLTGNNGLFYFMSYNVMYSNVTVNITSDLAEDGTYPLNTDSTNGYQLTIQPSAAATRIIYNASNLSIPMLRLFDIKNIVFDGNFNGSGRYLRFINTHTTAASCKAVFLIDSSCNNIIIRNSIIEGNYNELFNYPVQANIVIGAAGVNKQIEIRNNQVREAVGSPGTAGQFLQCISSNSNSNKLLTITGNELFNFAQFGINFKYIGDSCVVDSNHFYYNAAQPSTKMPKAINIENGKSHIISNNFIGGSAPACGGAPWTTNITYGAPFTGISVNRLGVGGLPTYITRNTIQNINMTYTGDASFKAIEVYGNMIITDNLVGHPSLPNSIVNAGINIGAYTFGIQVSGTDSAVVLNNIVANVSATGSDDDVCLVGLYIAGNGKGIVKRNSVYSLTSSGFPFYYVALPAVAGLLLWNGNQGYDVENNTIHDLKVISAVTNTRALGIDVAAGGNSNINFIRRNRVYNIENLSDSGWLYGINIPGSSFRMENNQIAITNGSNTNRVNIFGIFDQSDSSYYYYNTVYIGGNTSSGNLNSYAYRLNDGRLKRLQNNILYNERTGGGGTHYAIGAIFNSHPNPKWTSKSSNYNFFVTRDSAKIGAWGFTNTPQSMISWRVVSLADSSSFASLNTNAPSASFFQSTATGNLNINNNDPVCWYVNGKGLPVSTISGDYDSASNIRSTTIANGATDIGSDEFNTTTLPPPLIIFGPHLPGFTDSLILNQKLLATIKWGNSGTLPVFGNVRYYSGTWPNDTTNGFSVSNARTMNAWLDVPVTGGLGYSYTLTLYYDSSMLGKIQNVSQIVLHKKNSGEAGSWQMLFPTQINSSAKTATVTGLSSFSEFTGAEFSAPLAPPGSSICPTGTANFKTNITGIGYTYQWQVNSGTGFNNLINNTVYSGVTDSVLTITAPSSAYNRYQYRCITNTGAGTINSPVFLLKITSSWNGTTDTDWGNPLNWSCGQVPDANTDVLIRSGLTNYPIISTNVFCRSIIASNGSVIQVNTGASVQLTGQ
jgi:hypothetical protein